MGSIVEQEQVSSDQINNSTHSNSNNKMMESNWVITNGSFTNTITVESSDYPLTEPDSDDPTHNPPLILEPVVPESGPCEIKLCFERKYEISQIYVRSSARVYEVYYSKSAQSSNEYLCTVRCGVAERDDKVLQTALIKDVSGESGGSVGGTSVNSDDDWVNIKGSESEVGRSSFSDDTSSGSKGKNTQDLYEATAEINDADPCSSLTIRLLSLQDKSHVYVDEVYVYVDPADSTDSETLVPAPTASQSPLMAMFMPTLMQLTATGLNRAKDKHASDESHKDDNARKDQVDLKELDNGTTESVEIHQPRLACYAQKCGESREVNDIPLGRLEKSLEQLLSRVNAVEDICLRFEEKMLKPIQSMEARLQHVENKLEMGFKQIENKLETRLQQVELQMEKFSKSIHDSDFPRCTRISAPAFLCSESNSSSLYNEGRNLTISEEPEMEKFSKSIHNSNFPHCTRISAPAFSCSESNSSLLYNEGRNLTISEEPEMEKDLSCIIRPGLVVTVPEFLYGEDEEDNRDQKELEDTACNVPNKTLSVDDALAAALSGFLSTAKIQQIGNVEKDSGLSNEDEERKHIAIVESCQVEAQLSGAEDLMNESSSYTQIMSITASDFAAEEIGDDEFVDHNRSSFDVPLGYESHDNDQILSITPPGLTAEEIGDDEVVNINHSSYETALGSDSDTNDPELKKVHPSIQDKSLSTSAESCDLETNGSVNELESETNGNVSSGQVHLNGIYANFVESPRSSSLDFSFPILEVEFTSDAYASLNNPLESLFDGEVELSIHAPVYDGSGHSDDSEDGNTDQVNAVSCGSNGSTEHFLIDIGCHTADGLSNLDVGLDKSCTPSSSEITVSLI